jgi:hypothetical protein
MPSVLYAGGFFIINLISKIIFSGWVTFLPNWYNNKIAVLKNIKKRR